MVGDELLALRAARLARPLEVAVSGRPALLAVIGTQTYAFAVADVRRTSVIRSITRVPHAPPIVVGLGSLDGRVVAVFDAAVWSGGTPRTVLDRVPVLVLGTATPLVLAVDGVTGSAVIADGQAITTDGVIVADVAALLADPAFFLGGASG